jgi:PGF-pre-PGF domain-containing protein
MISGGSDMKHIISGIIMLILFSSVASAAAPVADFSSNPTTGMSPLPVTFTDLSTNSPIGWAWYFGDEDLSRAWTEINSSSGWSGRYTHSSVVLPDGSIVLTGGYDYSVSHKNDTWRSTDNGTTWTLINSSSGWSERSQHSSVALSDGSIVLMGGYGGSEYNDTWRSTNSGITWVEVNSSSGWSARQDPISVVLPDDSIILMGGFDGTTYNNDTWRSTDSGTTWTLMNASSGWSARQAQNNVVLPDGSILLMGGYDINDNYMNDTWRSTDSGTTWTLMNASSGWSARYGSNSIVLPDGSIVLMGGYDVGDNYINDTWRSTDNGSTWTLVNLSSGWSERYSPSSVVLPDGSIVLMGGYDVGDNFMNDTWRITTAGSTEQNPSHTYAQTGTYQVALQAYNADGYDNTIKTDYITATDPVVPVANFTSNVTSGSFPLIVGFTDLSSNSPTDWAWYFGDENLSDTAWTEVNSSSGWPVRYASSCVVLSDGSIVLMGGHGEADDLNDTWKSTDNGATWTQVNASSGWERRSSHTSVVLPDDSIVLMGGYGASYYNDTWRSTDNGATWTLMNASSGWSARDGHSSVALSDGSILLLGGHEGSSSICNDTWRSTDNGATWTLVNASSGWETRNEFSSVVLPDDSIVLTGGYGVSNRKNDTWRSTDNGATWTLMNASSGWEPRYRHNSVVLPDSSIVLIGGDDGSVYYNDTWRSTDNGATWTLVNASSGWEARGYLSNVVLPDGSIVMMGGDSDSGNCNDTWRLTTAGSTEQNPTHTYTDQNTYKVTLQAYNSAGYNITSKESYITVTEPAPVANFSSNVTSGEVPLSVNFTDTSTNSPTSWLWNFGDGTNSTDQNPIHSYTSAGTYNVSLNATNAAGSNISMQIDYITAAVVPVSNFSANVTSGGAPLSIIFTDNSLNSPTSWFWDYGDGSNSTSQDPTHTYTSAGTYNVSLNATNVGGSNVSTQVSYITAYAVPVANFSANITSGTVPLSVNFTDLSTNTPTSWYWDFGDGSNSSLQNPIHTYASAGTYTVSLNASNIGGDNISTQTDYIAAAVNPVANFSANVTSGATPLSVNFTDLSLNSPTSWFWDFGDGTNSTGQSPTHIYTSAGTYNVSLNATNVGGSNISTQFSYITTAAIPVSNFSSNVTSGTVPLSVNFTDLSTNIPTSWFWDFGDGSNSTVQNPIHTYTSAGTYNVSLNATNIGGSNISTQLSYITVAVTPVANFSANITSGAVPLSVNFTDFSTNSPTSWFWDFGDGSNSTDQSPTHTYTLAGTYNVSLNATNVGGSNVSTELSYITTAVTPVANFSANVTSGAIPLSVNFTDRSLNSPTSWYWDFGDGTNSTDQNATHTYASAGTYNVSLNATNVGGSNVSTELSYITAYTVPVSNFSANVTEGAVPLTVNFTDLSLNSPDSWEWDFGDGNNSTSRNPIHSYVSSGTYNVSLNATNIAGSDITTKTAYINVYIAPVANLTASVTSGTAPLSVTFTDLSNNTPTSWLWDFGDGSNSTSQNPTHSYTVAGSYNVTLNATNAAGSNVSTLLYYINVSAAPSTEESSNDDSGIRASVSQGQDPKIVSQSASSVKRVTGGSEVNYDFSDSGTPVLGVSFDAKDDGGLVVAKVQVLSSTPDGVSISSGNSYQMMSIDVGSEGTISSDSADNVMIHFKVSKQWMEENNIDVSTIRMTRYHGDQWNDLPTTQENEDGEYFYFYAETPGFSIFNVVGDEISETFEQVSSSSSVVEEEAESVEDEQETPDTPGFTAIAGIMFVSLAFLVSRRQKFE